MNQSIADASGVDDNTVMRAVIPNGKTETQPASVKRFTDFVERNRDMTINKRAGCEKQPFLASYTRFRANGLGGAI
jgi:hypothetical protein